ncbi:MAG TPA: hypothetical protein V6D08_17725 [Candidatus Obscuribacterales bacterium]
MGSNQVLPILVTGMGRSGSTLMMSLLGGDERCVFDKVYPFESRYLSLFASIAAKWQGWKFGGSGAEAAGIGMFPTLLRCSTATGDLMAIPSSREVFFSLWETFLASARQGNPQALFYAEKGREWVPPFLQDLLSVYTVYLFRDPRDIFLSINAFTQKTGHGFGREPGGDDLDHARTLCYRFLYRFENYRALKLSSGACSLVRYEDLVSDAQGATGELRQATGIEPAANAALDHYSKHSTTPDVKSSIGRWKREGLDPRVRTCIVQTLREPLRELNYDLEDDEDFRGLPDLVFDQRCSVPPSVQGGRVKQLSAMGMELEPADGMLSVELPLSPLAADQIDEMWVCFSDTAGSVARLQWRSANQDFSDERSIELGYDPGSHVNALRFNMRAAHSWRGQITGLRLCLVGHAHPEEKARTVCLRRIKPIGARLVSSGHPDSRAPARKVFDFFLRRS